MKNKYIIWAVKVTIAFVVSGILCLVMLSGFALVNLLCKIYVNVPLLHDFILLSYFFTVCFVTITSQLQVRVLDVIKRIGVTVIGRSNADSGQGVSLLLVNTAPIYKYGALEIAFDGQKWPDVFYVGKRKLAVFIPPGAHSVSFKLGARRRKVTAIDVLAGHQYVALYEPPQKYLQFTKKDMDDGGRFEINEVLNGAILCK